MTVFSEIQLKCFYLWHYRDTVFCTFIGDISPSLSAFPTCSFSSSISGADFYKMHHCTLFLAEGLIHHHWIPCFCWCIPFKAVEIYHSKWEYHSAEFVPGVIFLQFFFFLSSISYKRNIVRNTISCLILRVLCDMGQIATVCYREERR